MSFVTFVPFVFACLLLLLETFERCDARFERRVRGEEHPPPALAMDLQGGERLVPRVDELAVRCQPAQRAQHAIASGEGGAAAIGTEPR